MSIESERVITAISDRELDRRWRAAREEMDARKIDALIMQNSNNWLGGYGKWFTDLPATNGYPKTVIFHAADPMTLIEMGGTGVVRKPASGDPVHSGVGEVIGSQPFLYVKYPVTYHTDTAPVLLQK